jgi:hypothetical protein
MTVNTPVTYASGSSMGFASGATVNLSSGASLQVGGVAYINTNGWVVDRITQTSSTTVGSLAASGTNRVTVGDSSDAQLGLPAGVANTRVSIFVYPTGATSTGVAIVTSSGCAIYNGDLTSGTIMTFSTAGGYISLYPITSTRYALDTQSSGVTLT